jgi:hypothetical protein
VLAQALARSEIPGPSWASSGRKSRYCLQLRCHVGLPRFLIISACFAFASLARAETTIGRWCDRAVPSAPTYNRIIAIVATDDGQVELRATFADGSSNTERLEEVGEIYEKTNSASGDRYRIVGTTGNLQLIDNDGLIRTATRLENVPTAGECKN